MKRVEASRVSRSTGYNSAAKVLQFGNIFKHPTKSKTCLRWISNMFPAMHMIRLFSSLLPLQAPDHDVPGGSEALAVSRRKTDSLGVCRIQRNTACRVRGSG